MHRMTPYPFVYIFPTLLQTWTPQFSSEISLCLIKPFPQSKIMKPNHPLRKKASGAQHGLTIKAHASSCSLNSPAHRWTPWHDTSSKARRSSIRFKYAVFSPFCVGYSRLTPLGHLRAHGHHIRPKQRVHVVDQRPRLPIRSAQCARMVAAACDVWVRRAVLLVLCVLHPPHPHPHP
jgi:hypothetical protein